MLFTRSRTYNPIQSMRQNQSPYKKLRVLSILGYTNNYQIANSIAQA